MGRSDSLFGASVSGLVARPSTLRRTDSLHTASSFAWAALYIEAGS